MIRPVLTEIGIFLIPFAVYALYLVISRAQLLHHTSWPMHVVGWLALGAPKATPPEIVQKMSDLWVAAADSEPGKRMMDSFGLTEKPLNHQEVMKDYEYLKSVVIPLIVALGIKPE